jgi:CHASE3 domain sensor protein
VVETANEHERAEDDLNAQRNMAKWALFMLLATVAMAITTVFGVYYVWRTLNATQEMSADQAKVWSDQVSASLDAIKTAQ